MSYDLQKFLFPAQTINAHALLTPKEMDAADQITIACGIKGIDLMEAAGRAVAQAVIARWTKRRVAVLCGPGNNGGDGFVVARHLAESGWPITLGLLGDRASLKGDAAYHAGLWKNETVPISPAIFDNQGLIIDALFGSGLSRPIDGISAQTIEAIKDRKMSVCAIDTPSGLDGATGTIQGHAAPAELTVTFFRKKPGHLLSPGRALCGSIIVADIGIPAKVLDEINPQTYENTPELWRDLSLWPHPGVKMLDEATFRRLYKPQGDKLASIRKAAQTTNAIIVLNGTDTLIAAPNGLVLIGPTPQKYKKNGVPDTI